MTKESELIDLLGQTNRIFTLGLGTHHDFRRSPDRAATQISLGFSGVIRHDVDDQVIVVAANTPLTEVQEALMNKGQCIPYLPFWASRSDNLQGVSGTVAGHMSMNFPHSYEASAGSWKNWVLGARVVLADGLAAKCGSQVVKNVAGFDVHKLFIGARGTLGILYEITLRTWPVKALTATDLETHGRDLGSVGTLSRSLPKEYSQLVRSAGEEIVSAHPQSSTIYRNGIGAVPPNGWSIYWGRGDENIVSSGSAKWFLDRAKGQFDPTNRLNSREFGDR